MSKQVKLLDVDAFYAWDRYVLGHEQGSPFHMTRWRDLIAKNFKHKPYYLYRECDGAITGVLPLVHVRSPLLGSVLVSTPYAVYGGILADTDEDANRIFEAAKDLANKLSIKHIEFRNKDADEFDLPAIDLYHTFIKEIPEEEEKCLTTIPRKSRASARHGRDKFHLKFVEANDQLDRFYELFVLNKRMLGSPVFSKGYFRSLMDVFDGRIVLHCVVHEGLVVSAVMSFIHNETILPYYSGSDKQYERLQTNNFQYWQLMAWACRRGLKYYDFGRSRKETGAFSFKSNMGFEPQQLHYKYYFPGEGKIPNINPSNPKMNLPKSIMRKVPLPLAKIVGPMLVRHIP